MPRCILLALVAAACCFRSLVAEQPSHTRLLEWAPEDAGMAPAQLERVKPVMKILVGDGKAAGAVTIVARHGKVVLFEAVGTQDASGVPMQRDSLFRIYSMTKPITSVAVMMLVEEGKLGLDDPVAKHLPQLAGMKVFAGSENGEMRLEDPLRPPTVRDLLRHTSGLTYGFFGDTQVDRSYRAANLLQADSLAAMIDKLAGLPLLSQPGKRFHYSLSTDVLGRLVEVASGKSLDAFFQERIFTPLGMEDTAFFVDMNKQDRFTACYTKDAAGKLSVSDDPSSSRYLQKPGLLSGGGGLVSTAADYMRFCQMLLSNGEWRGRKLLKAETVREMTSNQLPPEAYPIDIGGPRPGVGFGLGFSVVVERSPFTASAPIGEYGWGGAASTHFWISPADGLAVVVMTQVMPFTFELENELKPLIYNAVDGP